MQFFPPHQIYTEAFGGAAGVLLQKPRSYAEVYNDLDGDVVNFFRVLQCPRQRAELIQAVTLTPYARQEFELAWVPAEGVVERARRLAVRAMMGFGSAGATKGSTGFRIDTRRQHGTAQSCWVDYPEAIAFAGQRLAGVLIENRPALDVLRQHDGPQTVHFVDPPYVHSTRVAGNRGYRHELSDADHLELLECLRGLRGAVVLSGYDSGLYEPVLQGWQRHETTARISAGRGTGLRTEVVWLNPVCVAGLARQRAQGSLFGVAA